MSFVFYDTETTGIDPFFDQILQFAAIKTDNEFRIEDEFEIRCRLRPHIVPAPGALCVTGVSIDQCTSKSLPSHLDMAHAISRKFEEWQGSVFLGWNTIPFDEEFLRQAFFQSLLPPYQTNTNRNTRTDLLPLAQAVYLDRPDALVVPMNARGRPSFKLDQLAPANGFPHLDAHDAMADVRATIHIAQILRRNAREHWSNLMRFSNKRAATDFIESEEVVILTEAHFGKANRYALKPLGTHPQINSEYYCLDLSKDPEGFHGLNREQLLQAFDRTPKPIRRIRTNRSPVLTPSDELEEVNGIDIEILEERADALERMTGLREALLDAAVDHYDRQYDNEEIEQQIYSGFSSDADRRRMEAFHEAPWRERAAICASFDDPRCRELGLRLICEHASDHASPEAVTAYGVFLSRRMAGRGEGLVTPWRSIAKARAELEDARKDFIGSDLTLQGLEAYLGELERLHAT